MQSIGCRIQEEFGESEYKVKYDKIPTQIDKQHTNNIIHMFHGISQQKRNVI